MLLYDVSMSHDFQILKINFMINGVLLLRTSCRGIPVSAGVPVFSIHYCYAQPASKLSGSGFVLFFAFFFFVFCFFFWRGGGEGGRERNAPSPKKTQTPSPRACSQAMSFHLLWLN